MRTEHRLIVENLSSRISWQVRDDLSFFYVLDELFLFIHFIITF